MYNNNLSTKLFAVFLLAGTSVMLIGVLITLF